MIIVRTVFNLKFGKAKEAAAAWNQLAELAVSVGRPKPRLLADITGPSYTMVAEFTYESLTEFEKEMGSIQQNHEFRKVYETFMPLVESSYREIFKEI